MRIGRWLRAVGLALTWVGSGAEATTTFSPPVRNAEGDVLTCFAQNHTGNVLQVASVLRDESGTSLSSFSTMIPSGQAGIQGLAGSRFSILDLPFSIAGALSCRRARQVR